MNSKLDLRVKGLKAHFDYLANIKKLVVCDITVAEGRLNQALQLEEISGEPVPSQTILDYDQAQTRLQNVEEAQRKTFDAWCHAINELALKRTENGQLSQVS